MMAKHKHPKSNQSSLRAFSSCRNLSLRLRRSLGLSRPGGDHRQFSGESVEIVGVEEIGVAAAGEHDASSGRGSRGARAKIRRARKPAAAAPSPSLPVGVGRQEQRAETEADVSSAETSSSAEGGVPVGTVSDGGGRKPRRAKTAQKKGPQRAAAEQQQRGGEDKRPRQLSVPDWAMEQAGEEPTPDE